MGAPSMDTRACDINLHCRMLTASFLCVHGCKAQGFAYCTGTGRTGPFVFSWSVPLRANLQVGLAISKSDPSLQVLLNAYQGSQVIGCQYTSMKYRLHLCIYYTPERRKSWTPNDDIPRHVWSSLPVIKVWGEEKRRRKGRGEMQSRSGSRHLSKMSSSQCLASWEQE